MGASSSSFGYSERLTAEDRQPPVARIELRHPAAERDRHSDDGGTGAGSGGDRGAARYLRSLCSAGEGKAFSAGVDVAAHTPDKVEEMLAKFHGVIRALVATKKVTIAAVHGHCLGGGAELAMVCDMVYTTEDAQWGFPEIKLGCYPPVACAALAAIVGQKRAAELILTGRTISGREAAQIGLATRGRRRRSQIRCRGMRRQSSPTEPGRARGHQEGSLCVGFDPLRQGPGPRGEDLFRRPDEDGRCARGYPRLHGEACAEVDGTITASIWITRSQPKK